MSFFFLHWKGLIVCLRVNWFTEYEMYQMYKKGKERKEPKISNHKFFIGLAVTIYSYRAYLQIYRCARDYASYVHTSSL